MKEKLIHLGFEVGTGNRVEVPLGHMVVFGMTQMAGKTTALEALISRAGVKAIAFVTKRGEGGFSKANEILPYLVERADWQSVQAILESQLKSKQDFKQAWIMRASEGADTLAAVQRNTRRLLEKHKKGMDHDMYYVLDHYFDLVIPQIEKLPKTDTINLADGLNVMNLEGYSPELQALVIRSVIHWVHQKETGVVTVIPEAWRFLPQARNSPVKMAAEELVREGAGLRNFMWTDSQDIAGVEKMVIRPAKTWLIGVQRERNELKRNLDNIPGTIARPKQSDIATLGLGEFFACFGDKAIKTYVQPAWMSAEEARAYAMGRSSLPTAPAPQIQKSVEISVPAVLSVRHQKEQLVSKAHDIPAQAEPSQDAMAKLFQNMMAFMQSKSAAPVPNLVNSNDLVNSDEEALFQRFKARLLQEEPSLIKLLSAKNEIHVIQEITPIKADGQSLFGRIVLLISKSFLDEEAKTNTAICKELMRTGTSVNSANVGRELKKLIKLGFITAEADGYLAVKGMKIHVKTKKAGDSDDD